MKEDVPATQDKAVSRLLAGVRLDLVIAVCALLISTLATGASWWQARVMQAQTQVLQAQLGAQVWPYVSVSLEINSNTVRIRIVNDGLGPAVLRSESATVDGTPKAGFIDMMHALLGRNLVARAPRNEKISLSLSDAAPGSVLRAGDSLEAFALTSKSYATPFLRAYRRVKFRTCYCAIIPGKCWLNDSAVSRDPQPVASCREIPGDLLHASTVDDLLNHHF